MFLALAPTEPREMRFRTMQRSALLSHGLSDLSPLTAPFVRGLARFRHCDGLGLRGLGDDGTFLRSRMQFAMGVLAHDLCGFLAAFGITLHPSGLLRIYARDPHRIYRPTKIENCIRDIAIRETRRSHDYDLAKAAYQIFRDADKIDTGYLLDTDGTSFPMEAANSHHHGHRSLAFYADIRRYRACDVERCGPIFYCTQHK